MCYTSETIRQKQQSLIWKLSTRIIPKSFEIIARTIEDKIQNFASKWISTTPRQAGTWENTFGTPSPHFGDDTIRVPSFKDFLLPKYSTCIVLCRLFQVEPAASSSFHTTCTTPFEVCVTIFLGNGNQQQVTLRREHSTQQRPLVQYSYNAT